MLSNVRPCAREGTQAQQLQRIRVKMGRRSYVVMDNKLHSCASRGSKLLKTHLHSNGFLMGRRGVWLDGTAEFPLIPMSRPKPYSPNSTTES